MKTIFVIDDSQEVLESISMILEDAGYNVVLAMEPERAFSLCNEISFDTVISDLYMLEDLSNPDTASITTGLDLIWRLKDKHPNVPIIAMSGHVEPRVLDRVKRMGIAGVLRKPFGREELLKVVTDAISSKEAKNAGDSK